MFYNKLFEYLCPLLRYICPNNKKVSKGNSPSFLYPGRRTKAPYVCTETTSPLEMLKSGGRPSSPAGSGVGPSLSDIVYIYLQVSLHDGTHFALFIIVYHEKEKSREKKENRNPKTLKFIKNLVNQIINNYATAVCVCPKRIKSLKK